MESGAMMHIATSLKVGSGIQQLMGDTEQDQYPPSLL
jgi:hypothetical protein